MATSNIEIQQQFNKLVELRNASIEQQNKLLKEQSELFNKLVDAAEKLGGKNDVGNNVSRWNKEFLEFNKTSGKGIDRLKEGFDEAKDKLDENTLSSEKFKEAFKGLDSKKLGLTGIRTSVGLIGRSISSAMGMLKGFTALAGAGFMFAIQAAKSITRFAMSVISFPFKILRGIIDLAGSSQGSTELAEAIEGVRKQFGYLDQTAGGAIMNLSRSMRGELANTGLSVMRILGNTAAVIRYFTEYAQNLGEVLDASIGQVGEGGAEALVAYNKALGFTAAGQKAIAARAVATGQSINEVNRQIANYSVQLSSTFGVTMKEVSRAVGEMMADVTHFGHLAPKELVQVSVYARKLGIDIKALGSVMDKFMNFEDTATAASNLSQAFGLNIDAFKLMQEQDPAKKIEMLRKSFFAAGKSIETMTYQERRLLAQQTGLDDASLQLAFSLKSQGTSYDQIQKKGDAAKKKQLSQTEVMEKLAGAIERLVKSGQTGSGGFFERFFQGFQTGIMWSSQFQKMIRHIRTDLAATYYAGIRLGRAFVNTFPGVAKVFNGISDLFSPRRFRGMLNGVEASIRKFFTDLDFGTLLNSLSGVFRNWFGGSGGGMRTVVQGVREFTVAFGRVMYEGILAVLPRITESIKALTNLIVHGPSQEIRGGASDLQSSTLSFFMTTFESIRNDKRLKVAIYDLGRAALTLIAESWERLRPVVEPLLKKAANALFYYALSSVAASIGKEILKSILTEVGKSILTSVGRFLFGQGATAMAGAAQTALAPLSSVFAGISASTVALGAALAAVGAIFAGFLTYPQRTQGAINSLSDKIRDFSQNIGKYIGIGIGYIAKGIGHVLSKVWDMIGSIIGLIRGKIASFSGDSRGFFNALIGDIQGVLRRILDAAANTVRSVFQLVGSLVMGLVEGIGNGLKQVFPEAAGTIDAVVGAIRSVGQGIMSFVDMTISLIRSVFNGIITHGGSAIATILTTISSIGSTVTSVFSGIYGTVSSVFTRIKDAIFGDIGQIVERFTNLGSTLTAPFTALMNLVRTNHEHSVNTIVGADMQRTVGAVQTAGTQMSTAMDNSFKSITDASSQASTKLSEKGIGSGLDAAALANNKIALEQATMMATAFEELEKRYTAIQVVSDEKLASLSAFIDKVGGLATRLQEVHSERIVEVTGKLVKDINEASNALRTIEPVNLETSLKSLANNLGLQELKEITIPQRKINMHINILVKIDAEELETVLIDRPNSWFQVRGS